MSPNPVPAGPYLQAVARGVEDYYLGLGEAPGRWIGGGCGDLDLTAGSTLPHSARCWTGGHRRIRSGR